MSSYILTIDTICTLSTTRFLTEANIHLATWGSRRALQQPAKWQAYNFKKQLIFVPFDYCPSDFDALDCLNIVFNTFYFKCQRDQLFFIGADVITKMLFGLAIPHLLTLLKVKK